MHEYFNNFFLFLITFFFNVPMWCTHDSVNAHTQYSWYITHITLISIPLITLNIKLYIVTLRSRLSPWWWLLVVDKCDERIMWPVVCEDILIIHSPRMYKPEGDPRWQLGCGSRQCEVHDSKTLLRCWSHTWRK
jgi:hypothetical protein